MHRFFVPAEWITADHVTLHGDSARQIARVLRLRSGEEIIALDNSGDEYVATLRTVTPAKVVADVTERRTNRAEPTANITLFQGMLKTDKFEFVLQKGTELGVSTFVPTICERSVARAEEGLTPSRRVRWERITTEAAEQSGRGRLPTLQDPQALQTACYAVVGRGIIPWEMERSTPLQDAIGEDVGPINIFIGPEGGFTEAEVETARSVGITPVTLGPRILRAETAAIATVTAVMYSLGELR